MLELEPSERVACVVCGGKRFAAICTAEENEAHRAYLHRFHACRLKPDAPPSALADRAEFSQDYSAPIVACEGCGLILRNPRPSEEAIRRAYRQDRYGAERLRSLFESQLELNRPKVRQLQRHLSPQARIVEVGSFVGGFLAAARETGWEALGVDPGEEVDAFCTEQGLTVYRGTLADLPMQARSADCIAIWNTFDQLPDPRPTLEAAQCLLRPGGLLALRVPNGRCFRLYTAWWRWWRHTRLRLLANGLLCGLVWNNLLAFPYLYGYSVSNLDRLLGNYSLHRVEVRAGTLCRLSDEHTRLWAKVEEQGVKAVCRLIGTLETLRPKSGFASAPWLDILYAKGERDAGVEVSGC